MNSNRNNHVIIVDGNTHRKLSLLGGHITDEPNIFKVREGFPEQMIFDK